MAIDTNWRYLNTVPDGLKFKVDGLNIWDYKWIPTGKQITIRDPLYGQERILSVYEIQNGKLKTRFAAGEFSSCMWGIYQEKIPTSVFKTLSNAISFVRRLFT